MSEDLTQNALQEPSSPDQMAGPTEATTTEEAKHDSPSPAVEQFEVPKKFLKADGSPDFERMTKAYVNLERTWSKKPNLPPASPDEYIWEKEADANLDAERVTEFKRQLHEKGFTKDQYAFIMDNYQEVIGSLTWTPERTEEVMKQEWGKDFTENTKAARAGFEHFAPSDADINDPVWNHPAVMKLLARLGSEVTEDSLTPKAKSQASAPESIDTRIAELRQLPNWHSDTKIQAELDALYAKKYA